MRTMRNVVGLFSDVIMMVGQMPRVVTRPGSGQVMPKFPPLLLQVFDSV